MTLSRFPLIACVVSAAVFNGYGYQSVPANRPWPPGVQKVADGAPALSAEEELKTFFMPPGYHLELVASEPLIQDPILIDWDPDGRMWAIEMLGYMPDIAATGERAPVGRIVVLEDTNGDGRMDKRTVFADGLVLPRALKVLDHGVLVGEPPNLWLMRDTNGDLKADTKELVTDTYGRLDAEVEHNANGLTWALDNWMYTSEIGMYLRLKNGKFEVRQTISRGQWGNSQDDEGRIYRNTNQAVLHVDLVPTPYFARNPNLLRTRGSYESLEGENGEVNTVWPVRPTPGVNRGYTNGILRADGSLAAYTSVSSPTVYRGDRLPAELYGNVFVTEPAANIVSRIIVSDDGSTLRARQAYDHAEFLTSTDERFRPVYLSSAPDGTMYVVDIYHGIIQHKSYITEYLRDQILSRKLDTEIHKGRIWRVVHDTTRRGSAPALSKASPAQLVDTLSHPNGWWRDTAQRLLVERGDRSVVPALKALAASAKDPRTRLHALWTLDGIDAIEPATVAHALEDSARAVRASAIRIAERWLGEGTQPIQAAVLKRLDDADWAVREQLAASIGALPAGARDTAVVALLEHHAGDPIVLDAALSGLRGSESTVLEQLMLAGAQTPQRDTAITMLTATIVRGGQDAAIQNVFESVADERRPTWQRSALLRGAEVALLGSAMPGAVTGRRGGAAGSAAASPCSTCPGGANGPGGAPAFPTGRATAASAPAGGNRGVGATVAVTSGGGGRGGGPSLRLNREPVALSAVADRGGDFGPRARSVLARVAWPGKPGAVSVAPLTVEEQRRFDIGQDVYKNICQACHQPDGRGQEKIAPSLVGSILALAPSAIPARILLNGKEGPIGLMPPIGSTLSDDQIAGVLTYIRREWGQAGSPVDVATVKTVRAQTAGRTRPWTNDELAALADAGRGGFRP